MACVMDTCARCERPFSPGDKVKLLDDGKGTPVHHGGCPVVPPAILRRYGFETATEPVIPVRF